jgi:hypothetical protein
MYRLKRLTSRLIVFLLFSCSALSQTVELINNHSFPIRFPIEVRSFPLTGAHWLAGDVPIQVEGSNVILLAQVETSSRKELKLRQATGDPGPRSLTLQPSEIGIRMRRGQTQSTTKQLIPIQPSPLPTISMATSNRCP